MIIEGRNQVREALSSGVTVEKVLVAKGAEGSVGAVVALARENGVRVTYVDKSVLDRNSVTKHHQGVMAYTTEFEYCELEDILASPKGQHHLILVLDEIEDPHNLGSMIRVADVLGADGVVIPARRGATVNETVVRTSAGATAYVKIAKVGNINDAIRVLKDNFVTVLALDMDGEDIASSHLDGDLALVVGNEGKGVKVLTRKLCDGAVSIPQVGHIDSLNASVAMGIALYEAVRQRR